MPIPGLDFFSNFVNTGDFSGYGIDPYSGGILTDLWNNGLINDARNLLVSLLPGDSQDQVDPVYIPNTAGGNIPNVASVTVTPRSTYPGQPCRSPRMSQKGCKTICGIDANGRMRKVRVNAAGEICPPRRMNPLNPRALARSMHRMAGFRSFAVKFDRLINRKLKPIHRTPSKRGGGGWCPGCRSPKSSCGCR